MQLSIQQLMPVPLRDRLEARTSAIWMQDLQWEPGEYVFVQAPSGTGKTTLIHMLYGLRTDYEGRVLWDGHLMGGKDPETVAGLRSNEVSIIFQDLRLFPELTAWENLEIKRSLTNTVPVGEVSDWMARLGIGDKKNAPGKTLSYGERQRVAIIRALLQPFQWLLMDEPFSHLDKRNTEIAASLVADVVRRNKAGFLMADLDKNHHFPYTQNLLL